METITNSIVIARTSNTMACTSQAKRRDQALLRAYRHDRIQHAFIKVSMEAPPYMTIGEMVQLAYSRAS